MSNDKIENLSKTDSKTENLAVENKSDMTSSASKSKDGAQDKNTIKSAEQKQTYCGHGLDEDIWNSFLTNKMFAHRGLWDETAPENSLGAFEKAIDAGYGIELDISPLEDNSPVVFHDSKMSRMTGKDRYIQNVSRDELKDIKLLNSNETIPTLEEVLALVNGRTPLLIEIKNHEKIGELESRVLEQLKNYKGEYAIQSFNPYILKWFYEKAPNIWRGQLASYFKGEALGGLKRFVLKRLGLRKLTHQNFVSYDLKNLPNRFTRKLEVPLLSWTIRNQEDYIKAIQFSDNVIFENCIPKI